MFTPATCSLSIHAYCEFYVLYTIFSVCLYKGLAARHKSRTFLMSLFRVTKRIQRRTTTHTKHVDRPHSRTSHHISLLLRSIENYPSDSAICVTARKPFRERCHIYEIDSEQLSNHIDWLWDVHFAQITNGYEYPVLGYPVYGAYLWSDSISAVPRYNQRSSSIIILQT